MPEDGCQVNNRHVGRQLIRSYAKNKNFCAALWPIPLISAQYYPAVKSARSITGLYSGNRGENIVHSKQTGGETSIDRANQAPERCGLTEGEGRKMAATV